MTCLFHNLIYVLINMCFISNDSYHFMCIIITIIILYCRLPLHAMKAVSMKIHTDYCCFYIFCVLLKVYIYLL
jgi:hypothetical protein